MFLFPFTIYMKEVARECLYCWQIYISTHCMLLSCQNILNYYVFKCLSQADTNWFIIIAMRGKSV